MAIIIAARIGAPADQMPVSNASDTQAGILAALVSGGAICHALSADEDKSPLGQPSHHHHECDDCPACHVAAAPVLLTATSLAPVPDDAGIRIAMAAIPPATGPPARPWTPSRPRGPPALRV